MLLSFRKGTREQTTVICVSCAVGLSPKMAGSATLSTNYTCSSTNSSSIQFKTLIPKTLISKINSIPFISSNKLSIIRLKPWFIVPPIRSSASSNSIDNGGNADSEGTNSEAVFNLGKSVVDFTANNFLPLALIGGVVLGLVNPGLGCLADWYSLSKVSTFCIFIISGLTLRSQEIGAAADAWPVGLFGVVSILFLTPVFSRFILQVNFQPSEFATGLAIFTCMPTSLSSGVSLTQLAKGNFALALAMTVISNLLGILVVPFTVSKFVGAGVGISIPTKQLFKSLVITLLIPLILGKVLREAIDGVRNFADNNRKLLSILNAIFLSLVPWIQVSKSRSLLLMVNPTGFLLAIGLGALLHIVLLVFNALAIKTLTFISGGKRSVFSNPQNTIALLLVASQKTLPVTVAVVDQLGGAMGASGLLVLPCVAAHLNQIILDSFLVNSLLRRDQPAHIQKAA